MARLTQAQRDALPDSAFAGPGRSYPVNDKNHARAALSMLHNAPTSSQAAIRRKAERKLGRSKGQGK